MKIIINEIIFKKIINNLFEQELDYELFDIYDNVKMEIFHDFLYNNNQTFTKDISWKVIPFNRLKKIWQDFMSTGIVRDERGLDMIEDIITDNIIKISIFTELLGHTQSDPQYDFDENLGYFVNQQLDCILQKPIDRNQLQIPFDDPRQKYKINDDIDKCQTDINPYVKELFNDEYDREKNYQIIYDDLLEKFYWYYSKDPKIGQSYISDFGLPYLEKYLSELRQIKQPEQKIPVMDKILNVVHQRSDMASWFVEGGSRSLSELSS